MVFINNESNFVFTSILPFTPFSYTYNNSTILMKFKCTCNKNKNCIETISCLFFQIQFVKVL